MKGVNLDGGEVMKRVIASILILAVVATTSCTSASTPEPGLTPTDQLTPTPEATLPTPTVESVQSDINSYFQEEWGRPYYLEVSRINSIAGVDGILEGINDAAWDKQGHSWVSLYERNQFDCSEMSALTEFVLENQGYTVKIAVGEIGQGKHAWLLIWNGPTNDWLPIEATSWWSWARVTSIALFLEELVAKVLGVDYISYDEYITPEYIYDTVYEAEYAWPGEFDWWNSPQSPWLVPPATTTPQPTPPPTYRPSPETTPTPGPILTPLP